MNTKLTLSVKEDIVQKAKDYAAENETTVSAVFEDFIEYVTTHSVKKTSKAKNPVLVRLFANIKKANKKKVKDFDYKEELTKSLMEKYNLKK